MCVSFLPFHAARRIGPVWTLAAPSYIARPTPQTPPGVTHPHARSGKRRPRRDGLPAGRLSHNFAAAAAGCVGTSGQLLIDEFSRFTSMQGVSRRIRSQTGLRAWAPRVQPVPAWPARGFLGLPAGAVTHRHIGHLALLSFIVAR